MIRGDDERDPRQRPLALLCFSTSRSDDLIPGAAATCIVSSEKPASYELFIPLHVHVPNFASFLLSGLFFTLFSYLFYFLSSTSCSCSLTAVAICLCISLIGSLGYKLRYKKYKKLELLFSMIHTVFYVTCGFLPQEGGLDYLWWEPSDKKV